LGRRPITWPRCPLSTSDIMPQPACSDSVRSL
jgi:hypothetical protein